MVILLAQVTEGRLRLCVKCQVYQRVKSSQRKPIGLLQQLPILDDPTFALFLSYIAQLR